MFLEIISLVLPCKIIVEKRLIIVAYVVFIHKVLYFVTLGPVNKSESHLKYPKIKTYDLREILFITNYINLMAMEVFTVANDICHYTPNLRD